MSVLVERHNTTLVVTLNRPESRNALDAETIAGVGRALVDAERDPDVAVIVLTGSGDRAFCVGIDLKAFAAGGRPPVPEHAPGLEVLLRRLYTKPVIAAVNGAALGGGFELALGCDLVVAAQHATFGLPEVRLGLVAAGCGIKVLGRRIPLAIALEIGLTGVPIDAERAYELGLVNRVVPGERVLALALELAETVAGNAPLAVRFTKEHMHAFANADPGADRALQQALPLILGSDDAREGAAAFAARRTPQWNGR